MGKTIKFENSGQTMTHEFKNFKVKVDFVHGRLFTEFDFKEQSMSLSDYQNTLNEFAELDKRLSLTAAKKKPVSEITVSEFLQVVDSIK